MSVFHEIRDKDPDGGSTQPTQRDYLRFEWWVTATYGRATWEAYHGTNWDEKGAEERAEGAYYGNF